MNQHEKWWVGFNPANESMWSVSKRVWTCKYCGVQHRKVKPKICKGCGDGELEYFARKAFEAGRKIGLLEAADIVDTDESDDVAKAIREAAE